MRAIWLVTLTAVLSIALVACAEPEPVEELEPIDALCLDMVPFLDEFQDGVDRAEAGESRASVAQTTFAANNIASVIEINTRQGLDTSEPGNEWVESVRLAAEVFVASSEDGFAGISDAEAIAVLQRIDQWFRYATERCAGVGA